MSVWNPDNIRDVAESVGIQSLSDQVAEEFAKDVEFRIGLVLEEALKFMRHAKRTVLNTQDISNALRVLDVEPLYGYESTRPLRFGEASIGPGQPLFYVEDEEVDFEKLINSPLPKVPREISFTAHWLAVEGVQPSIPQNPTSADSRAQELLPKGPGASSSLAAVNGYDNVSVKPLVKHIVSSELQLFFERIVSALADETNEEWRNAALASLRTDPGIDQLLPYFVQYVAEKVTHNLHDLFILTQMMHLVSALTENDSLYLDPYVTPIVPSVVTCLVGKRLGSANESNPMAHFSLRNIAAALLIKISRKYARGSPQLKERLARTCLKHFADFSKPFGTHYGAILTLQGMTGAEGMRVCIVPNLKEYDAVLKKGLEDETKKAEAEMVIGVILRGLQLVENESIGLTNGYSQGSEDARAGLVSKVGEIVGTRVFEIGRPGMINAVLQNKLLQ